MYNNLYANNIVEIKLPKLITLIMYLYHNLI